MRKYVLLLILLVVSMLVSFRGCSGRDLFVMQAVLDPKIEFIFELKNSARIKQADQIIASGGRTMTIGIIVKCKADYNPRWSFHFDPDTIKFADAAVEVCDSTAIGVEEHLQEACGSFLPQCRWCPWGMTKLSRA